eukprot:scaffold131043_cov19-Tisochrysis_lutea.AAC.2
MEKQSRSPWDALGLAPGASAVITNGRVYATPVAEDETVPEMQDHAHLYQKACSYLPSVSLASYPCSLSSGLYRLQITEWTGC